MLVAGVYAYIVIILNGIWASAFIEADIGQIKHGHFITNETIQSRESKNREKGKGLAQGELNFLGGIVTGDVNHPRRLALDLITVGLQHDTLFVGLALGEVQLCYGL
jgi:hypothetical protein